MQIPLNARSAFLFLVICYTTQSDVEGGVSTQQKVKSHIGREFVFGALDVSRYDYYDSVDIQFHVGAKVGGHCFVYSSYTGYNNTLYIPPKSVGVMSIDVTGSVDVKLTDGTALSGSAALHITSNTDISVLVTVRISKQDMGMASYVIYPVSSALSTSLTAAAYTPAKYYSSEVMVVGVTDKTEVSLTDGTTKLAVILDKLDTYQYSAANLRDLTGCEIVSNTPVIAFSGTSLSLMPQNIFSQFTPLATQMLPIKSRQFIVPSVEPYERLFVKVISNLQYDVTLTNKTLSRMYSNQGTQTYDLGPDPTSVIASVPVTLVQYNHPFMALVPGIDQYLSEYSFVVPDISLNDNRQTAYSLTAIVPTNVDQGLMLDGAPFNSARKFINVNERYTVLTVQVESGYHNMVHLNSSVRFGLLVCGRTTSGDWDGFGFFAGMDLSNADSATSPHTSSTTPLPKPLPQSNAGNAQGSNKPVLTIYLIFAIVYLLNFTATH